MEAYTKTSESYSKTSTTVSATCKRLGSRAAAVFDAIFSMLDIPAEYHKLLLFLFGQSKGEYQIEFFLNELADDFFNEERSADQKNWKRAAASRAQRFGNLLEEWQDWQALHHCQLTLYHPGYKIGLRSVKGTMQLPIADLFARIYSESRSTSAFEEVRGAKIKRVAEEVILNDFESLPAPSKRKPRSMNRNKRIDREMAIIKTRFRNLSAELNNSERAQFWNQLDEVKQGFILLPKEEEAVSNPEPANAHFYIKPCKPTLDSKEDSGKLAHEVEFENGVENEPQAIPPCDSYRDPGHSPDVGHSHCESQGGDGAATLEAFVSVGAVVDQVIFKNDLTKEIESVHRMTTEQFKAELPELIADADRGGVSLIVRVRGIVQQIGELNAEAVELLKPFSFVSYDTSEGNYQCWLAFKDDDDRVAVRKRLLARLKEIAPDANFEANGATRWPGSINQKPERNQWRIRLVYVNPERFTTPAELDDAGLLADPEPEVVRQAIPDLPRGNWWPDWNICHETKKQEAIRLKLKRKNHRSEADASYVAIALRYGHSLKAIAEKLAEVSPRAKQSGAHYINRTIAQVAQHLGMAL